MTLSTIKNSIPYACDGVTKIFPITFPFKEKDIHVFIRNDATKIEDELLNPTDFIVDGANVVTTDLWESGYTLFIKRILALTQGTDYQPGDPLPANTLEQNIDELTMMVQQLQEQMNRALLLPETTSYASLEFPEPEDNFFLLWRSGKLVNTQHFQDSNFAIQSFMKTFLESLTLAKAQENLGLVEPEESVSSFIKTLLNDADAATARRTLDTAKIAPWDSNYTYAQNDLVSYGGTIYKSLQNSNLNKNPATETTWWKDAFQAKFPIGTVLMYNGTGIANVETRSVQIGDDGGDTISLPGWYVCNGNASTPNLLNKFIRSESASGNTGGEDTHALTEDEMPPHNHYRDGDPAIWGFLWNNPNGSYSVSSGNAWGIQQGKLTSTDGGGQAHENKPAYYSLIFIIKMN